MLFGREFPKLLRQRHFIYPHRSFSFYLLRTVGKETRIQMSLFILMSENIEKRNPESGGLFRACADYLISLHPQCACNCKTLGSHLNWTILTNERIIVVLTMERCRLWSVGQCFNGEGNWRPFYEAQFGVEIFVEVYESTL